MVSTIFPPKITSKKVNLEDKPNPKSKISICFNILGLLGLLTLLVPSILFVYFYGTSLTDTSQVYTQLETSIGYSDYQTTPGITICNNNRLQKTKLCMYYPNMCHNETGDILFDNLYSFIRNSNSTELANLYQTSDEFIPVCTPSSLDPYMENCGKITKLFNEPMSNCYTLNSRWEQNDYYKSMSTDTSVSIGLDFQAFENSELFRTIGGTLYIHDARSLPNLEQGIIIKPGFLHKIAIRATVYYRLPSYIRTNCRRYLYENPSNQNPWPLSRSICVNQCILAMSIEKCDCVVEYIPQVKPFLQPNCLNESSLDCVKSYGRIITDHCKESCPLDCEEEEYSVSVESNPIPHYKGFEFSSQDTAQISLAFLDNKRMVYAEMYHRTTPDYFLLQNISLLSIWGLISLCLAIKIVSKLFNLTSCCNKISSKGTKMGGSDVANIIAINVGNRKEA